MIAFPPVGVPLERFCPALNEKQLISPRMWRRRTTEVTCKMMCWRCHTRYNLYKNNYFRLNECSCMWALVRIINLKKKLINYAFIQRVINVMRTAEAITHCSHKCIVKNLIIFYFIIRLIAVAATNSACCGCGLRAHYQDSSVESFMRHIHLHTLKIRCNKFQFS